MFKINILHNMGDECMYHPNSNNVILEHLALAAIDIGQADVADICYCLVYASMAFGHTATRPAIHHM